MFEEEIEVMTVDSEKLADLESQIPESYVIGEWFLLLSMYKLNESWRKVDQTVQRMHRRFKLLEKFWLRETKEKIARINPSNKEEVKEVILLFERGLQHGNYAELAEKFTTFLLSMY